MTIDRPWYYFTISTAGAVSEQGKDFFDNLILDNNFMIKETKDFCFLDREWLEYLSDSIENIPTSAMIFFRPAGHQTPKAHIDVNTAYIKSTGDLSFPPCAINLLYQGHKDDSEMIWYQRPQNIGSYIDFTDVGTAYINVDPQLVEEVSRCCIGNHLTLVRTDIPHNILMKNSARLCYSIRFKWNGWKNHSWEGMVQQCSKHLILGM